MASSAADFIQFSWEIVKIVWPALVFNWSRFRSLFKFANFLNS